MTLSKKFRKFLIVLLSIVTAISMALFTACDKPADDDSNDDTTNDTTEQTVTDFQSVANGDFEFYTNEKTTYPYSSAVKWTRSNDKSNTTSISSSATSGIIDTSDEAYSKLSTSSKPVISATESETVFFNPRTPGYYGLLKNEYNKDDEKVRHNPNVQGSKVLMINNKTSVDGQGTAQKFASSSTLTVPQNSYAILSLWVNTYDLDTVVYDKKQNKEYGAYVSITNNVGNVDYENLVFKNVNTEGKWVNLKLYVQGSEINATSFTITVGLGQGSKNNKDGYVEGFAYFDNITFTTYTKTEYNNLDEVNNLTSTNYSLAIDKNTPKADFVKSLAGATYVSNGDKADYVDEATATAKYTKLTASISYPNDIVYTSANIDATTFAYNKTVTNKTYDFETGNTLASKQISALTAQEKALFDEKVVFEKLSSAGNVAYIHFANPSSATFKSNPITVNKESRVAVTFFTQSKVDNSSDCVAKITLNESGKDPVDLFTDVTTVTEEGNYGYWTKYTVYLYNPTDDDTSFSIGLTFGLIEGEVTDTPSRDLPLGYAIIADMQVASVTEETYDNVLTGSNASKQTLYGKYLNFTEEDETVSIDEYNVSPDANQSKVIAIKPTASVPTFTFIGDKNKTESGIVNSKYVNADGTYGASNVAGIANLNVLSSLTTLRSDGITYNNNAQAILLSNKEATSSAFITSKATMSANSYTTIIVYVRATGDAVANVYLSTTSFNETTKKYDLLTIEGDENKSANISAKATATSHLYDGKWTEICFYLATGNAPIDYRVEIWNGARDGSANSVGTVFIDNVYVAESSAEAFAFDKKQYSDEYAKLGNDYKFTGFNYTRVATVKYTDENGKEAEKTKTFAPTEVFAGNDLIKFASFETIDADDIIDETTPEEDEEEDTTTEEDPYKASLTQNLPLLIISGIIAIALIVAIIVILVRSKKKKSATTAKKKEEYYSKDAREIALEKIRAKKANINVEKDEVETEYDYEEAAQISDEVTEEVLEETVEETPTEEVIDVEELQKEPEVLNNDENNN